ncbi:rRNA methylase, related [Neospora caninum Liverpool]|nr:rRNA methylase, related [Neospora caninum Liverpool]CBZ55560.1 rRNA methylase, related [Neospora caninum Liverpool]|eukprot:XP_003885588.1 rRNA methylase, related [Neospora caninum Liverpool]
MGLGCGTDCAGSWGGDSEGKESGDAASAREEGEEGEELREGEEGSAETATRSETRDQLSRRAMKRQAESQETGEVKRLTFITSQKNELIKHIVRLKRRSDLRQRYESVVVMGLPLVRFMCSPEYRRFASRQGGEMFLSAAESKKEDDWGAAPESQPAEGADARTHEFGNANSSRVRQCPEAKEEKEGDFSRVATHEGGEPQLKFELLLTDNPGLAGVPSAFNVHARETRCTYSEVMEFLMARRPLEFLPKKEKHSKRKDDRRFAGKGKDSTLLAPGDFHGFASSSKIEKGAADTGLPHLGMSVKTGSKRVVGILKRPRESFDFGSARCILALCGVRYVWNVGILVRTAASLGFDGVYYVDGTADPFSWKVMEVSRGLHYNLPHFHGSAENLLRMCEESDLLPIAADISGERPEAFHGAVMSHRGICCILGNESRGLSEVILQHCRRVALPMSSLLDSLNVGIAGGIVMYEMKKILAMRTMKRDTTTTSNGSGCLSNDSGNEELARPQLVAVGS